jgi:glycosyltransferase involved in cell wall biosynthesis
MLTHFGDYNELETIDELHRKSFVLPLGLDLKRYDAFRPSEADSPINSAPLILWNHRWESEKNPESFFSALYALADNDIPFSVALAGENVRQEPYEFEEAKSRLGDRIVQYGYMDDWSSYARLLWQADYVVSTAYQEFFGGAVAEAIYCGCVPILPNRLNYPHLITPDAQATCIYHDKGMALYHHLRRHLLGEIRVDVMPLQHHVSQFDWSVIAPQYDATLTNL